MVDLIEFVVNCLHVNFELTGGYFWVDFCNLAITISYDSKLTDV